MGTFLRHSVYTMLLSIKRLDTSIAEDALLKTYLASAEEDTQLNTTLDNQWRSQKFLTGDTLICSFPYYPDNPLLIYLIHYVTKLCSKNEYADARTVSKIRLDASCLNYLTNITAGFTHKSSYIHTF